MHATKHPSRINLTEVSTGHQLSEAQHDHPAVFLLVHDGQMDPDWHQTYSQVAQEKGLMAKFFYTTKVDLVQVDTSVQCIFCTVGKFGDH